MGVVSPLVQTYASVTPYITLQEFLSTPTALEVTDLVPGGTQAQQNQAMEDAIMRASSWADRLCHQILAATLDVSIERLRVNRWGNVVFPLKYRPVLEVQKVSVGMKPSELTALTDFSDVQILEYGLVEIPVTGLSSSGFNTVCIGSRPLVEVTYVNGWPNTTLAAPASVGASNITVVNPLGLYPGSGFTIYDSANTESLVVASSYTSGSATVPLTTNTVSAHATGVSASCLPPRVKAAVVLLTAVLIQTRGSDAIILDAMETPERVSAEYGQAGINLELAMDMLTDELERVK